MISYLPIINISSHVGIALNILKEYKIKIRKISMREKEKEKGNWSK